MNDKNIGGMIFGILSIGVFIGFMASVFMWKTHDNYLRHILSHVPEQYVLKAKERIAVEKTTGSNSKNHLSKATSFHPRDVKP